MLYTTRMTKIAIRDVEKNLAAAIERVSHGKDRLIIEQGGQPVAALVPFEDVEVLRRLFEVLDAYEDCVDVEEALAAKAEIGREGTVAWSDAKAKLGLE